MKSDSISLVGKVVEMNKGICTVEVNMGGVTFLANCKISGKMRQNKIKITKFDTVEIEVSAYDQSEIKTGRIVRRK